MKISSSRINWQWQYASPQDLHIEVEGSLPEDKAFVYDKRDFVYFAESNGFARYFSYREPGNGFGGAVFRLKMRDGETAILRGPWATRAGVVNKIGFGPIVDVSARDGRYNCRVSTAITLEQAIKLLPTMDVGDRFPGGKAVLIRTKWRTCNHAEPEYRPAVRRADGTVWTKPWCDEEIVEVIDGP